MAGEGGGAGEVGTGGDAGSPSVGGSGGTGGSGGASGAPATGGAAGDGTVDLPDSGVDGGGDEPDASGPQGDASTGPIVPVDSGVNGSCLGFTTGILTLSAQPSQDVVISRVVFEGATTHVTLHTVVAFNFADPLQLCSSSDDNDCVAVDDNVIGNRPAATDFVVDITGVDTDEGELALMTDLPGLGGGPLAYLNWNDHDSPDPDDNGPLVSLAEGAAVGGNGGAQGFWLDGESIAVTTENAIFISGESNVSAGFGVCTADQF